MPLRLTLLGTRTLEGIDRPDPPAVLTQPKRLALVALMAAREPERWVSRAELLGMLWPELDEARARKALSQALWAIRQDLGDGAVEKRGLDEVRLDPVALEVDVRSWLEAEARGDLDRLAALYGGPFLEGFHLTGSPAFDRWAEETRGRMRTASVRALFAVAEAGLERGERGEAAALARRGLDEAGPFDEEALRRGMVLLAAAGEAASALERFRAFERHLDAEGDTPSEATARLVAHLELETATPVRTPGGLHGVDVPDPATRPPSSAPSPGRTARVPGGHAPQPRARWRPRFVALALASMTLVALGAHVATRLANDREPAPTTRVAVAPFEYQGPEARSYLGAAVAELLGQRVDGVAGVRVAEPHAVAAALAAQGFARSAVPAGGLFRQLRADVWVRGSVVATTDGRLELRAWVHEAGEVRADAPYATRAVRADDATVFDAIDELAVELLAALVPAEGGLLGPARPPATRSLDAMRAFLEGEEAFQALRFRDAALAYQEAVRHDSTFALAYYRLSRALDWTDGGTPMLDAQARALALSERLPDRTRRLLEAYATFWERDMTLGMEELERLVADYPLDAEAWFQLGDAHFHGTPRLGGPVDASREPFERALALRPDDRRTALHLLALAARDDDPALARDLAGRVVSDDPVWRFQVAALTRWSTGEHATAREADSLLLSVPVPQVVSAVLSPADFLEEPELLRAGARRLISASTDPAELRLGHTLAALAEVAAGRPSASRHAVASLVALDPGEGRRLATYLAALPWIPQDDAAAISGLAPLPTLSGLDAVGLFLEGAAALRAGSRARADSAAGALEALDPGTARQWPALLGALIFEAEGEPDEALAAIERYRSGGMRLADMPGGPVPDGGLERLTRARLLATVGRPEAALRWYASVPAPVSHSLIFAAPAHLARARLLEALGRDDEAAEARARASRMWHDCDPALEPLL